MPRELGETKLALTIPGRLVGTPQYMAPEALQGQAVDLRADLFAVGAVLYEMLAGRPAFIGDSVIDVAHAVIHTAPPVLTGPPAVVAIDRVINHALAKRPEERYQTAGSLAADLRRVDSVPVEGGDTARPLTRLMGPPVPRAAGRPRYRVSRQQPSRRDYDLPVGPAVTRREVESCRRTRCRHPPGSEGSRSASRCGYGPGRHDRSRSRSVSGADTAS